MTADNLILIDAGRSETGWSRIGNAFKCRQLFAWSQVAGIQLIPGDGLTRGSMGHTMAAHGYARWGCWQGGVVVDDAVLTEADLGRLMDPEEAVEAWVAVNGRGTQFLPRVMDSWRAHVRSNPTPPGRVLGIEVPLEATLGWGSVDGQPARWGLWLTSAPPALLAPDRMPVVDVTPLDCPGHPRHGQPLRITRRIDMIWQRADGAVFGRDHKFMSSVDTGAAATAYGMDGGFRSQAMLLAQTFPASGSTALAGPHMGFRGVEAHLIGTRSPWITAAVVIPRSGFRESRFAQNLWDIEHDVARLELETLEGVRGVDAWPVADHDTVCTDRYNRCGAYSSGLCTNGPAIT